MRLPHVCTIQKPTAGAADAYGEAGAPTWSTDQANVACRFYDPEGANTRRVSGANYTTTPCLILPGTATIAQTSRITTTQAGYAGTYDLTEPPRARSNGPGAVHHYELKLRRVATT
ncbi:MAG TPA: hypothetical protein HA263_08015 [Methanoregulaceae archaeon]|nr:hypothetical protein [Methanoregulaceae archaeon]